MTVDSYFVAVMGGMSCGCWIAWLALRYEHFILHHYSSVSREKKKELEVDAGLLPSLPLLWLGVTAYAIIRLS